MNINGLIDRFGYTMEQMGHAKAEVAEYREMGQWAEAYRADQQAEKYRAEAQRLRKLIRTALDEKADTSGNSDNQHLALVA